jgi:hypothetical protein
MAGERTFVVKFISDTAKAQAGFKGLSGGLKGLQKSVGGAIPGWGQLAIGATAALGAIAAGLTSAVKAAMEDQKSQVELQRQLEKTFGANELLTASAERYVAVTQLRYGTSDVELRASLGTLVRSTGDLTESQNLLNLAQDISAATGKDLSSVSLALAKASQGQFTALSKLGIPLDENTKKSKDFGKVVGILNDQFGGAAETAANTFAGKLKILQGQFGEILETVGAALLPYLDKFATFLVKTVAPAVERITFVIGKYGLAAGFQQLVFESGKAGPAIINVVRGITIAFATLVNVVYKAVQLQIAQFKILKGDFGGALDALKNTTRDLINVGALESAFNKIAFGFNYAGSTALDLSESLDGLGYKIPKVTKSAQELADDEKGLGKVTKTLKKATEKLDEYNKSLGVSERLQDKLTKAGKSESGALTSLTDANTRLANAKAKLAQIEGGFGAGSPEALAAQVELAKAQRAQERATFAVEEAIYSVADAEMNLIAVRAEPGSTPIDIRRAELDLAAAKLSVADATDSQIESVKQLNDQQKLLNETIFGATVGSILYDDALKDVTDAFNDQVSAFEDWETAVTNTKDAQDELNKSLQATVDLILKYPKVLGGMPNPMAGMVGQPANTVSALGFSTRSGDTYAININAAIAEAGLPQKVVDALKIYNATVGKVPVRTN